MGRESKEKREQRLAEALRSNLRRRKDKTREAKTTDRPASDDPQKPSD